MTDTEKLKIFVKKLTAFGEDEGELSMWRKIFDSLGKDEQQKFLDILEEELKGLEVT